MLRLFVDPEVPNERIAIIGKFPPDKVMILSLIRLSSLPAALAVENNTVAELKLRVEPLSAQFFTVLKLASAAKRIVARPFVIDVV